MKNKLVGRTIVFRRLPRWRSRGAAFLACASVAVFTVLLWAASAQQPASFRFAIIGDRTGEAQPGVYERVWHDAAAENPAFVVSVGDTIQGLNDETADAEWQQVETMLSSWSRFPLYLAPGNHDIWSTRSEKLFQKYAGHPPHYSFDYGEAHFTVLDNSRSDQLSSAELTFLDEDLKQHNNQRLKFIVSHRPSWLLKAVIGDPNFRLHQIAKKYGARYVIAGHTHEMLHAELEGVDYISMVSAGGHLRATGKYEDGWFFGYAVVDVNAKGAEIHIHELGAPYGQGRVTTLSDWGKAGLIR
jgi:3',5'-cyclic-AMP phosphodiesterase